MALWNFFSKKKSPQDMLISGDLEGALKGFKRQLKAKDNKDPLLMLKIGGIYQQKGDPVRARMYYMAVGEYYGDQGFLNKAVAAYKKALDITPNDRGILEKLASYNNQVPKYMINSDILQRIRSNTEKGTQEQVEIAPIPPSPEGHYEEIDGTFRFPEMDDDTPETIDEAPKAFDSKDTSWEEQHTPKPSASPDEDLFAGSIFAHSAESEDEVEEDPYSHFVGEGKDPAAPQDVQPANDPVPPTAVNKHPLHLADPDFDPDASLFLEEEDSDSDDSVNDTPIPEVTHQPKGSPVAHSHNDAEKLETRPPTNQDRRETAPEDIKTASRVSDNDKMVFSSRTSSKSDAKASNPFKRSFSTLDDALEDLFSVGPDEDKAVRKEQDQRHFPLFRTMATKVFVDFVMALENQEFETGGLIVKQGSPGHHMFIIVEGAVDVILTTGTFTSTVASLHTGDFFGEAALLSGRPRTASIVAKQPTTCLVLSRNQLKELAVNHPSVLETIRSVYYARMVENESHGE